MGEVSRSASRRMCAPPSHHEAAYPLSPSRCLFSLLCFPSLSINHGRKPQRTEDSHRGRFEPPTARSQLYRDATDTRRTVAAGVRAEPIDGTGASPSSVPATSASALATKPVCATPAAILHPATRWHNAGRTSAARLRPADTTTTHRGDASQGSTDNCRQ